MSVIGVVLVHMYKIFLFTGIVGEFFMMSSSEPLPFSSNIVCIGSSGGGGAAKYNTSGRNSSELCSGFKAYQEQGAKNVRLNLESICYLI